jgi:hypothetical protein
MQKLLTYLIIIVLLASCEELSEHPLQTAAHDFVVVDGMITNEIKFQTITLSKPVSQLNEKPQPVSGATILVSSEQQVFSFHEDSLRPGKYISDIQFTGIRNKTYSLLINTGSKVYSAKAILEPPVLLTEFIPLQYVKNADDEMYRISKIPSNYNPANYAMFEILLDWSTAPGYETKNPDSCRAKLYYYTLPTIDVSEVFAPGSEKITFPAGTIMTQRRYSLTYEHALFFRALLLETTWSGGYFNTAPANIPTNMSEGATGFFGACGVMEKSEIVE